eukprot:scaffold15199_cov193-Alexandrium_tamarense.AAC.18
MSSLTSFPSSSTRSTVVLTPLSISIQNSLPADAEHALWVASSTDWTFAGLIPFWFQCITAFGVSTSKARTG